MTEYSRMAKGRFTAAAASAFVNLPFQPDFVELWNYTNIKAAVAANKMLRAWWDASLVDGSNNPTMLEVYNAGSVTAFDTIQTNGISSFQAGLELQYGPLNQHGGSPVSDFDISKAAAAVVTTVGNHGLQTGDVIIFQNLSQTATTGMQQIAGIPFMVTRTGATTFTIPWDTSGSNYTAFNTATSTGNVGSYKKLLYPALYFPGKKVITAITNGATTTVSTTTPHNYVVGQEVAFRMPIVAGAPTVWGDNGLNSLPNVVIPGSPIYGYVVSVTNLTTFVVNINSSSFSAFNVNLPFANVAGASFPQVVAVGDVNTGGWPISAGSPLYPSPQWSFATLNDSRTINGPAIQGAFVNNTRQGFFIGSGAANTATSVVMMAASDVIEWRAYVHDIA